MLLEKAPTLDKEALCRNLRREGTLDRVFIFELGIDEAVKKGVADRFSLEQNLDSMDSAFGMKREIAIHRFLGIELVRIWLPGSKFSEIILGNIGGVPPIREREDIDRYDWPDIATVDFSQLDWYEKNLPEDMGIFYVISTYQVVQALLGFEGLCMALADRPDMVEEICTRIGSFCTSIVEHVCEYDCVSAVMSGDDFGFKTSLLIHPDHIRRVFLPWQRLYAERCHRHGKFYFSHSCGKVDEIMDDLIDDVKADAKHSFEDVVVSVTEAKRLWGNRISLLGGLDVDFVARSDEDSIRRRVKETLDICMPGGGYCLGMGNWVTGYTPVDNYLTVVDEARRYSIMSRL